MANDSKKNRTILIKAGFEGQRDPAAEASAYLFDRAGVLIASAPLAKNEARLTVADLPRGARLFIGPTLDMAERAGPPSLSTMERISAFEPPIRLRPDLDIYELPRVPELIWPHWPLCRCRVKGRVIVRRTSPSGVVTEAPVCDARVHICEVDRLPWLIERLPDIDIYRLRDDLIEIIRRPFPWPPEPEPGPWREQIVLPDRFREHTVLLASKVINAGFGKAALNPQPLPPAEIRAFNPQPDPPGDPFKALPQTMQFALRSRSTSIIRRGLIDHLELVRPWICHWPWLHRWFYTCDELRVVTTNDRGEFDATIWYPCRGDKPDLYFWVDYAIDGIWTPVHRPPIPCNVWWNYPCGTDVTITVTDPRVPGCSDRPPVPIGKQIVVTTIGREVSMGEINREPSIINPGADAAKAGTVKPPTGFAREAPFGASVDPRVDFGIDLTPAGISHYRWSYRALGSVNEADWAAIGTEIRWHYRETPAVVGDPPIYKSVLVGPDPAVTGSYYFKTNPVLPAGGEKWFVLDERHELASARWDTTGLAPGKYELKLELFKVAGGVATRADLTANSVAISQIVDEAPLTAATYIPVAATHDRLLMSGAATVGYRLVIHVDNRSCFGTIESVTVAPGDNDTKCGFLEYAPSASATIVFRASHPGNYATFDFDVSRVATPLPNASASGLVDASPVNGFVRAGNQFSKSVTVFALLNDELLLGETACTRAAFGESLRVYALATDGYSRLSGLDAPVYDLLTGQIGLRAFAITPA